MFDMQLSDTLIRVRGSADDKFKEMEGRKM